MVDLDQAQFEQELQAYPFAETSAETAIHTSFVLEQHHATARAERWLRAFLEHHPQALNARYRWAELLLSLGRWDLALPIYESRFELYGKPRTYPAEASWQRGQEQPAKLLVWTEQGWGDAIQCFRFLPRLAASLGSSLSFECREEQLSLFRANLPPEVDVFASGSRDTVTFTQHAALTSLPWIMAGSLRHYPQQMPYLSAPETLLAPWQAALAPYRRKVALIWAGTPANPYDNLRSVALEELSPLSYLAEDGVHFFNLQKFVGDSRFDVPPPSWLLPLPLPLNDFADTAAALSQMDLVISVDTAPLHLAAALGRPSWLLNRHPGDPRWLEKATTSKLYPSLRLFRQQHTGRWAEPLTDLYQAFVQWQKQ